MHIAGSTQFDTGCGAVIKTRLSQKTWIDHALSAQFLHYLKRKMQLIVRLLYSEYYYLLSTFK